jgi:hypothetical protein
MDDYVTHTTGYVKVGKYYTEAYDVGDYET